MKKWICLCLALLLFSCALAEEVDLSEIAIVDVDVAELRAPTDGLDVDGGTILQPGEALEADLNGDGAAERLCFVYRPGEYDSVLTLILEDGAQTQTFETYIVCSEHIVVIDLDGDGVMEILFSGDECSDDYLVYCLHYLPDGALVPLSFPNLCRFIDPDDPESTAEQPCGYGQIVSVSDGRLTLMGSQDVLGTWMSTRTVALENGAFVIADDGIWRVCGNDEEDIWEWRGMTPVAEIAATDMNGNPTCLTPEDTVLVTAFDKASACWVVTRDGRQMKLSIAPNTENGWSYTVNGVPAEELFAFLPYAD